MSYWDRMYWNTSHAESTLHLPFIKGLSLSCLIPALGINLFEETIRLSFEFPLTLQRLVSFTDLLMLGFSYLRVSGRLYCPYVAFWQYVNAFMSFFHRSAQMGPGHGGAQFRPRGGGRGRLGGGGGGELRV